jgi:hypothetical protein
MTKWLWTNVAFEGNLSLLWRNAIVCLAVTAFSRWTTDSRNTWYLVVGELSCLGLGVLNLSIATALTIRRRPRGTA